MFIYINMCVCVCNKEQRLDLLGQRQFQLAHQGNELLFTLRQPDIYVYICVCVCVYVYVYIYKSGCVTVTALYLKYY